MPNQFWKHKNHLLVIDAIKILTVEFPNILIVCSGQTKDYRNPDYFKQLEKHIFENGVSKNIKILGHIEYEFVKLLMLNSMALINPSLLKVGARLLRKQNQSIKT